MTTVWMATLLWLASVMAGKAQTPPQAPSDTSANDQASCAETVEQAKASRPPQLLFLALPRNQDPARDRWHLVHSAEAQQQGAKGGNSSASAFLRDGQVVVVQFTFQNEFGDWVSYVDYCFRPDGTLSHVQAVLNSFHGDATVVRDASYNDSGQLMSSHRENYALGTHTPKKLDPDFWDQPPPVFLHVSDLPFANELPARSTSHSPTKP